MIWNPNRTDIHEVVLGEASSPEYDISPWVTAISYNENIVFENNDDAIATNLRLQLIYDENADPIEITHRTLLDGTPIRVFQGDQRVPKASWVPIFTGVLRGVPTQNEESRSDRRVKMISAVAVDRSEKYLNKVVTARSYEKGTDIGKAVVETAVEWMYLDRREIRVGFQNYEIAHLQSQLVDIEVLKGLHQMLFTTGKKPRFDAEGFLVAADTDLDKPPVRRYLEKDFVVSMTRDQILSSGYNSVRLLGLDDELTSVVERVKRLAHGSITAGFFEDRVNETIYFSEADGEKGGGRRAKNTFLGLSKVSTIGDFFGEELTWTPKIEPDGYTVFEGQLSFDTGVDVTIRAVLIGVWLAAQTSAHILRTAADGDPDPTSAEAIAVVANIAEAEADAAMVGLLLSMTEIGRVYWEIHGEPFTNVYQQLASVARLDGILTEDVKELPLKNDWLHDIDYMQTRAEELLRRELVKNWGYTIVMLDDPLVETDDVIDLGGKRFYITSIRKSLGRPASGLMTLTGWRIR